MVNLGAAPLLPSNSNSNSNSAVDARFDPVQLLNLLNVITTSRDTALLQQSTVALNSLFKNPQCLPALVEIACSSQPGAVSTELRLLAAVEARKRIRYLVSGNLGPEVAMQIARHLSHHAFSEVDSSLRRALARVAAVVARLEVKQKLQPCVITDLPCRIASSDPNHREVALYLLSHLCELEEPSLLAQLEPVIASAFALLADQQSAEVRVAAVRFIGTLTESFGEHENVFKMVEANLPMVFSILRECIATLNESGANHCFDAFVNMLRFIPPSSKNSVLLIAQASLEIFANTSVDTAFRVGAGNVITMLPYFCPSMVSSLKLVDPILTVMPNFAVELSEAEVTSTSVAPEAREAAFLDVDLDDCDESSVGSIARQIINSFSTYVKPKGVYTVMSRRIAEIANDSNPLMRRSAALCLRLIVDGCASQVEKSIKSLTQIICRLLADPDAGVRKDACITFNALVNMYPVDSFGEPKTYFSLILGCLQGNALPLVRSATFALDTYIENLDTYQLIPYLNDMVNVVRHLLGSFSDIQVQQAALALLGSIANGAGSEFVPYFNTLYPLLVPFTASPEPKEDYEHAKLRTIAISTISSIVDAVGAEVFRPHFEETVNRSFMSVDTCYPRIKNAHYQLLSTLARLYKAEFVPVLAPLIKKLEESILCPNVLESSSEDENGNSNDFDINAAGQAGNNNGLDYSTATAQARLAGVADPSAAAPHLRRNKSDLGLNEEETAHDLDGDYMSDFEDGDSEFEGESGVDGIASMYNANGEQGAEDGDDSESEDELDDFRGVSAIADEKSMAISVLGVLYESLHENFVPYLERAFELVNAQIDNPCEVVRQECVLTLLKFASATFQMRMVPKESLDDSQNLCPAVPRLWVAGLPLQTPMPQEVAAVVSRVMPIVVDAIKKEDECSSLAEMCDSLAATMKIMGPYLLAMQGCVEAIVELSLSILRQRHEALVRLEEDRREDAGEEGEGLDDASEEYKALFSMAVTGGTDLIAGLAIALGPQFSEIGKPMISAMTKLMKSNEHEHIRAPMLGCIAEICLGARQGIAAWSERFFKLILAGLADTDPSVRSNAAYALGAIVLHAPQTTDTVGALTAAHHALTDAESSDLCMDNSVGAIARIEMRALTDGTAQGHLGQALDAILPRLPLKVDAMEHEPVFELFMALLARPWDACSEAFAERLSALVPVFAHVTAEPHQLSRGMRSRFVTTLKSVVTSNSPMAAKLQAAFQSAPTDVQTRLASQLQ